MDEEQVKALIQTALGEFGTQLEIKVSGLINTANQGVAANLTREIKKIREDLTPKPTEPTDPPQPTDSATPPQPQPGQLSMQALQQQLKEQKEATEALKAQQEAKEKAALISDKKALISQAIAAGRHVSGGVMADTLWTRWNDKLTKEGDQWFIKDGEQVTPFDTAFEKFVGSEDGKIFLPPSGTTGAGSQESTPNSPPPAEASLDEALMQAFSI